MNMEDYHNLKRGCKGTFARQQNSIEKALKVLKDKITMDGNAVRDEERLRRLKILRDTINSQFHILENICEELGEDLELFFDSYKQQCSNDLAVKLDEAIGD